MNEVLEGIALNPCKNYLTKLPSIVIDGGSPYIEWEVLDPISQSDRDNTDRLVLVNLNRMFLVGGYEQRRNKSRVRMYGLVGENKR
jgi:hypothetical protein